MKTASRHSAWYRSEDMPWSKAVGIALAVFAVLALVHVTPLEEKLDTKLTWPINFWAREKLGRHPTLHPRLKVFAVDYSTLMSTKGMGLAVEDWSLLVEGFGKAGAKAVLVDNGLAMPFSWGADGSARLREIFRSTPAVFGVAVLQDPIPGRPVVDSPQFELASIVKEGVWQHIPWLKFARGYAYGPSKYFVDSLRLGHLSYSDYGLVPAFASLGPGRSIPQWALKAADSLEIRSGELLVDGRPVSLDAQGRFLVNFFPPAEFWSKTYSLLPVLERMRRGGPTDFISPGDYVVLLHHSFIGDQRNTPVGTLPTGFILVNALNGLVSGNWLSFAKFSWLYVLLGVMVGMCLAVAFRAVHFWLALGLIAIGVSLLGILAFSFWGMLFPWSMAFLGVALSGSSVFLEKTRVSGLKSDHLRVSLSGMVDVEKLAELINNPSSVEIAPSKQILTVMFLDLVGFSKTVGNEPAEAVFDQLRDVFDLVTPIIHKHGGSVDKNLGDGMLCFFGYQFGGKAAAENHMEKAFRCAEEIQRENLRRNIGPLPAGRPPYPIRIGLNTSEVYIGDLGGKDRIELTLIGHGVNLAQRFEGACESYMILCGRPTQEGLIAAGISPDGFEKRQIAIKHFSEPLEAYQWNPLSDREKELEMARAAYETYRNSA